jgi:putative aldouronate transport system substrate-binding protein
MKLFIRILSKAFLLAFLPIILIACKGSESKVPSKTESIAVNPPGILPIAKEPVTLKLAFRPVPEILDHTTNEFTHWLEEETGVHLEFQMYSTDINEARQKLNVYVSSGSELPDAFMGFALPAQIQYNYGRDGVLIALNDYFDKYAVNFKDRAGRSELGEDMLKYIISPDGNIYGFPIYTEQNGNARALRAWINKPWLDKLGLSVPGTTEEFYVVLRAFKEQDPNGNGLADEIPLIGTTKGWYTNPTPWIMNAFIYDAANNADDWVVENGKLSLGYERSEYRDGLAYLNRLCKEGLLSPLTYSQDMAQMRAIATGGDVPVIGVHVAGNPLGTFNAGNARMGDYVPLPPLKGPKGVQWATHTTLSPSVNTAFNITSTCKYPEIAFRFVDFLWGEEAFYRSRFGIPGRDWVYAEPDEQSLFAALGYKPSIKVINETWGKELNVHWGSTVAHCQLAEYIDGMVWNGDPLNLDYLVATSAPYYLEYGPKEEVYRLIYEASELEEVTDIQQNLTTYVNESTARFVIGDLDVNKDWDSYTKELKTIGTERYIELGQKAFDRLNDK